MEKSEEGYIHFITLLLLLFSQEPFLVCTFRTTLGIVLLNQTELGTWPCIKQGNTAGRACLCRQIYLGLPTSSMTLGMWPLALSLLTCVMGLIILELLRRA